ncbi:MAG: 30S ribosomal protein S3, partial [Candidatus Nealsonbacteria bacterium]|nr:30S ribosomal protein S3 [Candidatus Nealsonbacteria bacterium]
FYGKKLGKSLEEDLKIREFLNKKLGKAGIERIEIERFSGKVNVIISAGRPGLIIGRGGQGLEELKKSLERAVFPNLVMVKSSKSKTELKLEIREVRNVWTSAPLVGQWVAAQLEKRVRFRRVLKQVLDKTMVNKGVEGVRVEVAGRLDGAEIARTEWLKRGRLPRQTLRADIDYAQVEAHCTYGIVGIKVWLYKGEKFE